MAHNPPEGRVQYGVGSIQRQELPDGNHCNDIKKHSRLQRAIASQPVSTFSIPSTAVYAKKMKKAERDKGLLAALLDAPLDILCEVSLHLSPVDLLCLSKVSHALRNFYLSKRNKRVWFASFASVDLPPCPEDLSGPQYASLMFDSDCMACNAPNVKSPDYILRVRFCKECRELNVVDRKIVVNEFISYGLHGFIPAEFEELKEAVYKFVPTVVHNIRKRFSRHSEESSQCYRPDFYDALVDCLQQYRTMSAEEFRTFVQKKVQLRDAIYEHAKQLQAWKYAKEDARTNISKQHEESVKAKLRDLGYTDEDWNGLTGYHPYKRETTEWKNLVYQRKELTERTWRNLRPKLEEFLTRWRRQYNRNKRPMEFNSAYFKYLHDLNLTNGERIFMPMVEDMKNLKVVQEFIFHDNAQRPITDEIWNGFVPTVQEICGRRKMDIISKHSEALIKSRGPDRDGILCKSDPLHHILLASSFFSYSSSYSPGTLMLYYFNNMHSIGMYTPPSARSFQTSHHNLLQSFKVINLSTPDTLLMHLGTPFKLNTPMSTMQRVGQRFICCRCTEQPRKLMGWSALVLHYICEQEKENRFSLHESSSKRDHMLEGGNLAKCFTNEQLALGITRKILVLDQDSA